MLLATYGARTPPCWIVPGCSSPREYVRHNLRRLPLTEIVHLPAGHAATRRSTIVCHTEGSMFPPETTHTDKPRRFSMEAAARPAAPASSGRMPVAVSASRQAAANWFTDTSSMRGPCSRAIRKLRSPNLAYTESLGDTDRRCDLYARTPPQRLAHRGRALKFDADDPRSRPLEVLAGCGQEPSPADRLIDRVGLTNVSDDLSEDRRMSSDDVWIIEARHVLALPLSRRGDGELDAGVIPIVHQLNHGTLLADSIQQF